MSNEKWNDTKIEDTLKQLPPVKDEQSKDDLFQAIETRSKEKTPARFSPRSKRPWILPAIASAAAIFLILLIIPPLFNGDQQFSTDEAADQNNMMDTAAVDNDGREESVEIESGLAEDNDTQNVNENNVVNEEVTNDNSEMGVADSPEPTLLNEVIYLASNYSVDNDSSNIGNIVIKKQPITSEWSLEDILMTSMQESDPTSGQYLNDIEEVTIEQEIIRLRFASAASLESLTSAEHGQLNNVLQELLSLYGIEEVAFEAEGKPGIIFGQYGEQQSLPLSSNNRGYYLIDNGEDLYLVSARVAEEEMADDETGAPFDFADTVAKMAEVNETVDWYESAIPDSVNISDVRIPGTKAEVYYTISNEEALNEERLQMFFHALKLSAMPFTLDNLQVINEESGEVIEVDLSE
jgi:hypothetical protein